MTDKEKIKRKNEQIQILEARVNLRNKQLMELQTKLEEERKEKQETNRIFQKIDKLMVIKTSNTLDKPIKSVEFPLKYWELLKRQVSDNPSYANSSKNDYRRDKINQEIRGIQMGCGKKFDTDLKICGEEMEEGTGIVWLCPDCWEKENKSQGDEK